MLSRVTTKNELCFSMTVHMKHQRKGKHVNSCIARYKKCSRESNDTCTYDENNYLKQIKQTRRHLSLSWTTPRKCLPHHVKGRWKCPHYPHCRWCHGQRYWPANVILSSLQHTRGRQKCVFSAFIIETTRASSVEHQIRRAPQFPFSRTAWRMRLHFKTFMVLERLKQWKGRRNALSTKGFLVKKVQQRKSKRCQVKIRSFVCVMEIG